MPETCNTPDPASGLYAAGGFIPSESPAPIRLDPDECVVTRDRRCIRPGHPTPTSDGNQPGASWVCE